METTRLTRADFERGFVRLNCGYHVYVFRASLAALLDLAMFEQCPRDPTISGVRRDHVEGVYADSTVARNEAITGK